MMFLAMGGATHRHPRLNNLHQLFVGQLFFRVFHASKEPLPQQGVVEERDVSEHAHRPRVCEQQLFF
eukprot:1190730-Alexandrium_andersonii.AAC.1